MSSAPAVWSSAKILEFDFAGIEQVLMGWFFQSPRYIRIAKLGTHAIVASNVLARQFPQTWHPADLSATDKEIGAYLKTIKKSDDAHVDLMYNQAKRTVHGCVPGDHEVLTPNGWVRFDALTDGTPVAQWDNGSVSFVVPSHVTRSRVDDAEPLVVLDGRGLQIQMTADHRVPLKCTTWNPLEPRRDVHEVAARNLPKSGRIPVSGWYDGRQPWAEELALLIAGQADGQLEEGKRWTFHLRRPRKIQRLRMLLERAGIPYSDVLCACHDEGHRIRFTLDSGDWLVDKRFNLTKWMQLTEHGRGRFLQEIVHWDGTVSKGGCRTYLSTDKVNAITVQTLAHLNGCQGLLRDTRRCGFSGRVLYSVSLNRREYARLECLKRTSAPKPDTVYCVTVPSTYFLVKWKDRISVTGNTAYGLTTHGMCRNFPKTFPTVKSAEAVQRVYFDLAPEVPTFHTVVRHTAHEQHFLGGPPPYVYAPDQLKVSGHPYGYMHWFWSVVSYRRLDPAQVLWHRKRKLPTMEWNGIHYATQLGEDAKRCVAMYPQGTARGVLTEACFPLFDPEHELAARCYIGDFYYGHTPLRAPIHDSLLLECPTRKVDALIERVAYAMQMPVEALPCPEEWGLGSHLTIGVDAKMGPSWGEMKSIPVPSLQDLGVANDAPYTPAEDEDEEDVAALEEEVA